MAVVQQAYAQWSWPLGAVAADPQLNFFENMVGRDGVSQRAYSMGTLSVHLVNIPLSISFNYPVFLMSFGSNALSNWIGDVQMGLYSMTGSTLSLANSANAAINVSTNGISWVSLVTSATQNISPGNWYFAANILTSGVLPHTSASFFANSSINPGNADPSALMRGRMTASTNAMPASIATSDLDITGSDSNRQPYIILTA